MLTTVPAGLGMALPRGTIRQGVVPTDVTQRRLAVVRPVRFANQPRHRTAVAAVGLADPLGVATTAHAVSVFVTSAAVIWGALALSQKVAPEQDRLEGQEPCPACGGTGVELCFCAKWSDGDAGCNACGHTGYTKCRSCGGGGTAVPIRITVGKDPSGGTLL